MNKTKLAVLALFAILLAEGPSNSFDATPPAVTLDSIKAAREKFNLEMKLDTKRPWDGMELTGPNAFTKKPPTENPEITGQGDRRDH